MKEIYLYIKPVAKPRQTRSDVWKQRPCVMRYRAFCDEIRLKAKGFKLGDEIEIKFYIPMPKSWSKNKRAISENQPHQSRPDLDNLIKSVCDAFEKEDSFIWRIKASKYWLDTGTIYIKNLCL